MHNLRQGTSIRVGRRAALRALVAVPAIGLVGCGDDAESSNPTVGVATTTPIRTQSPPPSAASASATPAGPGSPPSSGQGAYTPPATGEWERADPKANGWSQAGLADLVKLVGDNRSASFMMLTGGRILVETYFGANTASNVISVASVQKSVCSTLIGMAREKRLLQLDDPVSKYLEAGWSKGRPAHEAAVTLRHAMTHSSGLDPNTLESKYEPGKVFQYNTDVYQKLRLVLEKATGKDINTVLRSWLLAPVGASEQATWVSDGRRDAVGSLHFELRLTARDMARFGLFSLRRGDWGGTRSLASSWYDEAWASSSVQKDYGLLWWLMGKRNIPGAPADWVAALGASDQKVYVVPSLDLVVTRQGLAAGEESENTSNFDNVLFRAIAAARL